MRRRPRIVYTDSQKALMWDRWQKGESIKFICAYVVSLGNAIDELNYNSLILIQ